MPCSGPLKPGPDPADNGKGRLMDRSTDEAPHASVRAQDRGVGVAACHQRLLAALLSTSDASAALSAVCHEVAAIVGCDRVQIWRGDLRQRTMHATVAVGYDAIDAERVRALSVPMHGLAFESDFLERKYLPLGHADVVSDFATTLFAEFGIRASAFALVERGERILGALQLSWCGTPTPAFPDRELIDVVRAYTAIAVDMHARTDEAVQTATILSETAMLLASIHDPMALMETVARRITDAIGCDAGVVHLIDEEGQLFRFSAGAGPAALVDALRQIEGNPEHFGQLLAASEDDLIEFPDLRADPRMGTHAMAANAASFMSVPLRRGDRLIGSMTLVYAERTGRFARRQVTLAKGLAHHAVVALETARLVRSLEEANRVKSDFVAAVSHDLRTPIHILVGYADMLLDGAAGPLVPEQRELVDNIRERSLQFKDLVDGILAVARLDAQRGRALAAPIRLDQLCASIARELDDRRAPGVALRVRAKSVLVEVDAPKVRMILRNLVSNALKFTTAGAVTMVADSDGTSIRLQVSDTGPGIDPAERAGIFEMFHQGAAGRRAGGSGLGLGLYLVRRLSQVMGGTARLLEADPGKTRFEVILPLRPPPAA
jgi:signal transduction histidine kinase